MRIFDAERKNIFSSDYIQLLTFVRKNNNYELLFLFFYKLIITYMNIYVGNLSYNVRENDLKEAIAEYGQVNSCKLIIDRETRRSKGFAFVEMSDDEAAKKVIAELNGAEFDGRPMVVKEALPKN